MIPVRLPATFEPHVVRDDCLIEDGHPLYGQDCPACGRPIGTDPELVALVAVGIAPEDRQPAGWTTGGAVAVHTACARATMGPDSKEPKRG